jgi:hypothetical protein
MAQVSDGGKEEAPDRLTDPEPNAIGVPSAELSLGWMLASRANLRFTRRGGDTASVSRMQDQPRLPVRKAGKSVANEWPFFVQRMGSTSNACGWLVIGAQKGPTPQSEIGE